MTDPVAGGSGSTPAAPGAWFPDPLERYDSRYHNGREWTADVAVDGQRFVDPLGVQAGERRNRAARTSMVLGIIGVAIAWMPFLFVPGLVASLLALWFGVRGFRHSTTDGTGRSHSVVGLTTGACGALAAIGGAALTFLVLDVVDRYENPNPHTTAISTCEVIGSRATAEATITNEGSTEADFTVTVSFLRPGTDNTQASQTVDLRNVAPGRTAEFTATRSVDVDEVDCVVSEVTGPLPFRLDF